MKKILVIFAVLCGFVFAQAKTTYPNATYPTYPSAGETYPSEAWPANSLGKNLSDAIEVADNQKQKADFINYSKDAHLKSVVRVEMKVASKFYNQVHEGENVYKKRCAAVRIHPNWLVASLTCRGTDKKVDSLLHDGTVISKEVEYRNITEVKIDGIKLDKGNTFIDEKSKLILFRVDNKNEKLINKLAKIGNIFPVLLVAEHPKAIVKAVEDAYINLENFCLPGRDCDRVGIDSYCLENKCFKTEWELFDGDAGDPLFILTKKFGTAEFLAGLNIAEINGSDKGSGRYYKVFDEDSLAFLEKIIGTNDRSAWKRISGYIVSEKPLL